MRCTRRLALGALASAVLAACGGGGGDGVAGGDAAGEPAGSGGGGGGDTPPAQSFSAFGPSLVASNASANHAPAVARLAGGGNVVLWMRGDGVVRGRFTDAAGNFSSNEFSAIPAASAGGERLQAGGFAVAAAPDGGFVAVWARETTTPTGRQGVMAVQARRFSAGGDLLWDNRVSDGLFAAIGQPVVEPWNGGFIVGWTAQAEMTAPQGAYLRGLGPDGGLPGRQVQVAAATGNEQEQVGVAPLADGSLVAVWRERTFDGSATRFPLYAQRFAFDLASAGAPVALPGFSFASPYPVDAETLPDGNVAIAWAVTGENSRPFVNVGVFTPALALASTLRTEVLELAPADIRVLPLGPSGFGVAWQIVHQDSRETTSRLSLWRFDAAGAPTGAPAVIEDRLTAWVSPTTGFTVVAGPGFDMKGGADGHWVAAFHRANATQAGTYLMGR